MAKSKNPSERWALDSSVLISHFKGGEMRGDICTSDYSTDLLRRAEAGEAMVIVSALTIVEVYKPHRKMRARQGIADFTEVDELFAKSWVDAIEVGRHTARIARDLCRDYGIPSWDAIHMAAAIAGEADILYCWDRSDLIKHGSIENVRILEPPKPEPRVEQSTLESAMQFISERDTDLD